MQVQIEQDFHQKKKPQPSWKSSRGAQAYDLKNENSTFKLDKGLDFFMGRIVFISDLTP